MALSNYWLTQYGTLDQEGAEYVLKLNAIRRAMANFVSIITGRDIRVSFSTGKQSYSVAPEKGEEYIVISATTDPALFDANVGLVLHEAAHLILSKWSTHAGSIPAFTLLAKLRTEPHYLIPDEVGEAAKKIGRDVQQVGRDVALICNALEDRRIDAWMYLNAAGYRGYYEALYETYWQSKKTAELLQDKLSRRKLVKCYLFHLANMTNAAADPDALPGLSDIWQLVDLPNIARFAEDIEAWRFLESSGRSYLHERFPMMLKAALKIAQIIYENVADKEDEEDGDEEGDADGQKEGEDATGGAGKPDKDNLDIPDIDDTEGTPTPKAGPGGKEPAPKEDSSPSDPQEDKEDAIDELLKKQQAISDGDEAQKTPISAEQQRTLEAMQHSGAEMKFVGDFTEKAKAIVYHRLTPELLGVQSFPFTLKYGNIPQIDHGVNQAVKEGAHMGNLLASRLTVLADESLLTFTRQRQGKLDKRLIAGLGFEEEAVFSSSVIERMDPISLHLTLDASGSMKGVKWNNTIRLAVALAKAATLIPTLHVSISLRTGGMVDDNVHVLIAFDSTKDEFTKITRYFPYLHALSGTPEGLAFEAIKDYITSSMRRQHSRKFFINISDGMPEFTFSTKKKTEYYAGEPAYRHTALQVRELHEAGFSIMSYFIGASIPKTVKPDDPFQRMYGATAQYINPQSVNDIARTLNKLFLQVA